MNWQELATRCEQAEGPDYQLDREIAAAVGHPSAKASGFQMQYEGVRVPNYTASIDAALTLVGCDFLYSGMHMSSGEHRWGLEEKAGQTVTVGVAKTPALALCAAALRASQQGGE